MQILPVNNYNYSKSVPINFGINLSSKKLIFKEDDFYVRIKGYGHHSGWAKKVKETADCAVNFIRKNLGFEDIIKRITTGVIEANQLSNDADKRVHTGILRIKRQGWHHKSEWGPDIITRYSKDRKNRYSSYTERLDYTVKHPLKNPYNNIVLTRPIHDADYGKFIAHANPKYIDNAFYRINKIYDELQEKYIQREVQKEDLEDVNNSIAEIRWILAHATPWERGSDAISNTFIRSIYKAMGIKAGPLKRGVSLDLEAYCTNIDEYKKNFPCYFNKKPEIID